MNTHALSFHDFARHFVADWIDSWNSHDVNRILSHYDNAFTMRSPIIALMGLDPSGVLAGKEKVGAYWSLALQRIPDLRFKLIDFFVGADVVSIHYQGAQGRLAVETFKFNSDRKIIEALATYKP